MAYKFTIDVLFLLIEFEQRIYVEFLLIFFIFFLSSFQSKLLSIVYVLLSVTISEHAYAGIQAGLSLLGLGGGVSVGLSVKLAVIPALANVMSNFFDQYYDENHETSTVLSFLRNFEKQIDKLKKVSACSDVGELFENIMIGFEIGIDISLTRGLMTLGVATVLPTLGLSFGVPVVRIAANAIACKSFLFFCFCFFF